MAIVKPFAAVRYNNEKVKDLSKVVCPPYDIIQPERQRHYHELDPHNFLHILLGKDVPGEDKYKRAASLFSDWLSKNILSKDEKPAVYFYSHQYKIKGETRTRLGFIALLRLGEKDCSALKHEHTHQDAKDDRYSLLKQVKANLSPIFMVFKDKFRVINFMQQKYIRQVPPVLEVADDEGGVHRLWKIEDAAVLEQIERKMRDEKVFIADGHHRFEVACSWRDEMSARTRELTGEEPFNYVMAYFTNTDPRGLLILPIHRLLRMPDEQSFEAFLEAAREYFDVEDVKDKTRFLFLMEKSGGREHIFGVYHGGRFRLLRLRSVAVLNKLLGDKPPEYRRLDVSILNRMVFENIFRVAPEKNECLKYSAQADELIKAVDADPRCVAFFLNPVKIEQIMDVALAGQRMPPKSTYFYPKVLSGLLINKLE